MKKSEKTQYLNSFVRLKESISKDIENLALMRSRVCKTSPRLKEACVKTTKVVNRLELDVEKIILMQDKINEKVNRLVDLRIELEEKISAIEDLRLGLLLKYRYIDGMCWNDICEKLYISPESKQIFALHKKALEAIEI